jgi:hypothetical protein
MSNLLEMDGLYHTVSTCTAVQSEGMYRYRKTIRKVAVKSEKILANLQGTGKEILGHEIRLFL